MLEKSIKEMNLTEKLDKACQLLRQEEAVAGQLRQAEALRTKLSQQDLNVTVIGQFKRGKSALSNCILGESVLPVGIVPITSAVTRVRYGKPKAEVRFLNGVVEEVQRDTLHQYISEQENKNNQMGVAEIVLQTPSEFLQQGLTFVDTPGVGSFHKNNTEVAYDHMRESDAVIFLLSVDSPINQIEIDFLKNAQEFAGRFYFAVNKIDTVAPEELEMYCSYCQMVLAQITGREDIKLYPVSAKTGDGVEALKSAILADTKGQMGEIIEASIQKKLVDLIDQSMTQLKFYWKAMNLEYKELDEHFAATEEILQGIRQEAEGCEGNFLLHLNEYKLRLSACVEEEFGMQYHYDIDMLKLGVLDIDRDAFLEHVGALCDNLRSTLDRILLYREENAYTVCHRINGINRLTRELRRIKDSFMTKK